MVDKKAEIIHEYELREDIPEELWYTEWLESYQCFKIKLGINPKYIEDRYDKALIMFQKQNFSDIQYILEITLDHNIKDKIEFSIDNIENMITQFVIRTERLRRIGIIISDKKIEYLLQIRDTDIIPELLTINQDFVQIQNEWFSKSVKTYLDIKEKDMKILLSKVDFLKPRQERINFQKELRKRGKIAKIYLNENFSDYDFRAIENLQNSVFINCDLQRANFSYVNLENVLFINSNLNEAIFLGAYLNGCQCSSDLKDVIDIYKRFAVGDVW